MILRFQGRDGQFRLNVQPTDEFPSLISQLADHLPKDVDLQSVTVSNRPHGGDARGLATQLKGVTFQQVGLR